MHIGEKFIKGFAPGGIFGAAQSLFERVFLGFQGSAGLGHGLTFAGQGYFHPGLHDIERQQARTHRYKARVTVSRE